MAAASHLLLLQMHTQLIPRASFNVAGESGPISGEGCATGRMAMETGKKKKATLLSSVCPPTGMIKAPLWMLFLSSGCFDRTIPQLAGSLRADGRCGCVKYMLAGR